ncbi:hypothetical protein N7532_003201 [Penicillium argentinense]|uniref:Uncharacterized protein n=1 Tax=Penicillium argentinense TaxID=1131581 RepID=A0A9W9FM24_9EURO|nr:uncharacterized protein N7532_003201 [Penicillium argentinense]KAJ5102672.1 hypothetical protein N7532_003201 [Penicillium argentinense]
MNVMKVVTWACYAWHVDGISQNIRNCFSGSGWLDIPVGDQADAEQEELMAARQWLWRSVEKLEQINFIHKAMEVNTFINPPFESSERAFIEEEQMATQASSVEIPEGDSDEEVE